MKTALIPLKNYKRDLKDIPSEVLESMKIIPITTIDEVIEIGLL